MLTGLLTEITHKTGKQFGQCLHDSTSSQRKDSQLDPTFCLCFTYMSPQYIYLRPVPMIITLGLAPQAGPSSLLAQTRN